MRLARGQVEAAVEPLLGALADTPEATTEDMALAINTSIAISLKRIADALGHMTTEPCNNYGETFVPAIARAISDGMAGRV